MSNTTALVKVPSFRCVDVSRELGFLGIQAKTNVEIQPVTLDGISIAKIDVSELPSAMRTRPDQNPILLAFKFLHTSYDLQLQVTKHGDVDVLVAAIDACWVDIVIVPEGKIAYSIRMGVRNTEKQFVRIDTHDSEDRKILGWNENVIIWSAAVAGNSVKPARDESGKIMIPLQKRNLAGSKRDDAFLVELSYMIERADLGNRGNLNLILPKVDIPISQMFVKVFFPKNYTHGDFTGSIEEVKSLSKQEDQYSFVTAPTAQAQQAFLDEQLMMETDQLMERMEKKDEVKSKARKLSISYSKQPMYIPPASKAKALGNTVSGIVPIKVVVPRVGQEICFERLVVKSEHLKLSVSYKKIPKTKLGKLFACCC